MLLEPLLHTLDAEGEFWFQKQIVGYYYYVEVLRYQVMDVVFEEADLAAARNDQAQQSGSDPRTVFHPNGSWRRPGSRGMECWRGDWAAFSQWGRPSKSRESGRRNLPPIGKAAEIPPVQDADNASRQISRENSQETFSLVFRY